MCFKRNKKDPYEVVVYDKRGNVVSSTGLNAIAENKPQEEESSQEACPSGRLAIVVSTVDEIVNSESDNSDEILATIEALKGAKDSGDYSEEEQKIIDTCLYRLHDAYYNR